MREDIISALVLGYNTAENKDKVLDPDLVVAMANEVMLLLLEKGVLK